MDDVTRHPDDETLFDLVEGTLDPARAETVERHMSRCAACAAFVSAARAGSPGDAPAVEEMPETAAERMRVALGQAWDERAAASAPAAADTVGSDAGFAPTEPLRPDDGPAGATPARRPRRTRRFVPILAFAVLGALAGTSIYLGERDGGDAARGPQRAETTETTPEWTTPEPDSSAAGSAAEGGAGEIDREVSENADTTSAPPAQDGGYVSEGETLTDTQSGQPTDASKEVTPTSRGSSTAVSGQVVSPPQGYDDFIDQDRVCAATRDETDLTLPDGRLAQQILAGPLGIYVVCG